MKTDPVKLAGQAVYYRAHHEVIRERHRAYREANRAKLNAYQRDHRKKWTPEKRAAYQAYQKAYQAKYVRGYQIPRPKKAKPYTPKVKQNQTTPTFTKAEILEFKALLKPKSKAQLKPNIAQCTSCDVSTVRGSATYFEGTTDRGAWLCFSCSPMRMEA